MGKVSTNSYAESMETGKIYLNKKFYENLPPPMPVYQHCKECNCILKTAMPEYTRKLGYCSTWCFEESEDIKKKFMEYKEHKCHNCGEDVSPMKRKSIKKGKPSFVSSGVYPKYCDKCSPYTKRERDNLILESYENTKKT